MPNPTLAGLASSVTFDKTDVNAGGRLIDADVTFADADDNFNGGRLVVSGLLSEDRVAIRHTGMNPGEIGLVGSSVTYGGTIIGIVTGGIGGPLTVALNSGATSAAVDALIQSLTYANVSGTPTATRTLRVDVVDAAGGAIAFSGNDSFVLRTGTANPFNSIDVGNYSAPSFADFDGDGDLDLVVGDQTGLLRAYRNSSGVFTALTGTANPFNAIDAGTDSAPIFVDLDGDKDADLVLGANDGTLRSFRNDAGTFIELTGTANPMNGIDIGNFSKPTFVDIDRDGDQDLVVGHGSGDLTLFRNTAGAFVAVTGAADPFPGPDIFTHHNAAPAFLDMDGDGDLDLLVGDGWGNMYGRTNQNNGSFVAGGVVNFTRTYGNYAATPTAVDIDGDGDMDLVSGISNGRIRFHENTSSARGLAITVTVASGDGYIDGDSGNDVLSGTAGADMFLLQQGGNDTVSGNGGNDGFYFGAQLTAADIVNGGDGEDAIYLEGDYTLTLGANTIAGIERIRLLNTVSSDYDYTITTVDQNVASGARLLVTGADLKAGEDLIFNGSAETNGAFDLLGGLGTDSLTGGAGNDTLDGGGGNDSLDGRAGNDTLTGGAGNDMLVGGAGADALIGGDGIDTASYAAALAGVTLDMRDGTGTGGDAAGDTFSSVENVIGSAYNDVIAGTTTGVGADNILEGGLGDDQLNGRGGNDILLGQEGNDSLRGGSLHDTLDGGSGTDIADYSTDVGNTIINLSSSAVTVGGVTVAAGQARDITGHTDTFISIEGVSGATGDDVIYGSAGDNMINGNGGNDTLIGGGGVDTLTGGTGVDTFRFAGGDSGLGSAADRITDFVSGTDKIDLSAIDANSGVAGDQAFTFIGAGAFSGTAGQLRYATAGGDTRLEGDLDGDGVADFSILLTGTLTPLGGDFVL